MAVVALVCLPLVYLVIRVSTAVRTPGACSAAGVLELVWNTVLLVGLVTGAALVLGVPLAWLVTRTDLPVRRFWAVAAALPLVIPSYVAALALLATFGRAAFSSRSSRSRSASSVSRRSTGCPAPCWR